MSRCYNCDLDNQDHGIEVCISELREKLARANRLNCVLVSQNCKLIERNRNLGDTAAPWSASERQGDP